MADRRGRVSWAAAFLLAGIFVVVHTAFAQRNPFEPSRLTVMLAGTGAGTVEMTTPSRMPVVPGKPIDLRAGSLVTLNPQAAAGSRFSGWTDGVCKGTAPCSFTLKGSMSLTARFDALPMRKVTVNRTGAGQGTVTSAPPHALNGSTASVPEGSVVTLTAAAPAGQAFRGWSGDCTGTTPTCIVTMTTDRTVTARFEPAIQCGVDKDGDGHRPFGAAPIFSLDQDCTDPGEVSLNAPADDCVDTDRNTFPGATEVAGDGIDQNCDGAELCWVDRDGDGYRARDPIRSADADCRDAGELGGSIPIDSDDNDPGVH